MTAKRCSSRLLNTSMTIMCWWRQVLLKTPKLDLGVRYTKKLVRGLVRGVVRGLVRGFRLSFWCTDRCVDWCVDWRVDFRCFFGARTGAWIGARKISSVFFGARTGAWTSLVLLLSHLQTAYGSESISVVGELKHGRTEVVGSRRNLSEVVGTCRNSWELVGTRRNSSEFGMMTNASRRVCFPALPKPFI